MFHITGGWSEGGAMAMNMAYRFTPDVRGVFVIGSYLPNNSMVYEVSNPLTGPISLERDQNSWDEFSFKNVSYGYDWPK